MAIIYLDGPEKSGKSYIAKILEKEHGARVRHWGPVDPDDRVYLEPLISDAASGELVVWDRGWAAEHVYAYLLGRNRRLRDDAFLGEWLYGRVVQAVGVRAMILGPSVQQLRMKREDDDLPVEPMDERRMFYAYGQRFGYLSYNNQHTEDAAHEIAAQLAEFTKRHYKEGEGLRPPHYVGHPLARLVVVGQDRNEISQFPGAWAPFSTPLTTMLGREFEADAFKLGWTNAEAIKPQLLEGRAIMACGEKAQQWVKYHVPNPELVVDAPHPAYAYRYSSGKGQKAKDRIITLTTELRTYLT